MRSEERLAVAVTNLAEMSRKADRNIKVSVLIYAYIWEKFGIRPGQKYQDKRRAGHFRYFFIFSIIKSDFLHFFSN